MSQQTTISTARRPPDVGVDAALNALYDAFDTGWMRGKVFYRARKNTFPNQEGRMRTLPQVYMGKGEYYNCLPNDNLPATLFFRTDGSERTGLDKARSPSSRATATLAERPLSLVFWADLTRISPGYSGDYIYTEQIKEEFVKTLHALPCVRSVDAFDDSSLEVVFEGYDFPDEKKQYNKFPFACFRIDFTVTFRLKC